MYWAPGNAINLGKADAVCKKVESRNTFHG